jgi:hypothetical protein
MTTTKEPSTTKSTTTKTIPTTTTEFLSTTTTRGVNEINGDLIMPLPNEKLEAALVRITDLETKCNCAQDSVSTLSHK